MEPSCAGMLTQRIASMTQLAFTVGTVFLGAYLALRILQVNLPSLGAQPRIGKPTGR